MEEANWEDDCVCLFYGHCLFLLALYEDENLPMETLLTGVVYFLFYI